MLIIEYSWDGMEVNELGKFCPRFLIRIYVGMAVIPVLRVDEY